MRGRNQCSRTVGTLYSVPQLGHDEAAKAGERLVINTIKPVILTVLWLIALTRPLSTWAEMPACEASGGHTPVCGFSAPEDIVVGPQGYLLIGQMAPPGGLRWLDPASLRSEALPLLPPVADGSPWGQADCARPPADTVIHGLDLSLRADGRWQLLAVNHGSREAIEFYELQGARADLTAVWRGCARAPQDVGFNDVAALPGGGFLATNMAPPDSTLWPALLGLVGFATGEVWHWSAEGGFTALAETRGRFPNGIVLAPGGDSFYVNMYLGNRVQHFSWPGLELLGEVSVKHPDNSSWASDGSLLVASQHANILDLAGSLGQPHDQPSFLPYSIVRIDPVAMEVSELFFHEGPPMGAGTVAVELGSDLWVGSYVGDRVVRVPLQESAPR